MQTIIFGGAFDPPHFEHKKICLGAMRECCADKLVLVPTYNPPHKGGAVIDFSLRVKMLEELFSDCDCNVEISEIEKEVYYGFNNQSENETYDTNEGNQGDKTHNIKSNIQSVSTQTRVKNYSSDTLKVLASRYTDTAFLIGGDSLLALDTWHKPQEVLAVMPILVAGREGFNNLEEKAKELKEKFGGEIRLLKSVGAEVSSSLLKAKLYLGLEVPLDSKVKKVISDNHLFQEYRTVVEKLKGRQSPELFFHSLAVCLRAVDINVRMKLGLEFDEVFLASLLHDNSKEMLDCADIVGVPLDAIGTPVLHQFLGAQRAKSDFGIDNPRICDAIRYHTTAKAEMNTLEKLIYSADMLSEDRDFDGLNILLKQIYSDFEEGFFACLEHSYYHVLSKGRKMYPLTDEAYKFYSKQYEKTHKIS